MHGLEELGFWLFDARVRFVITMGGFHLCSNLTCMSVSSLHIRIFLRKKMSVVPPCQRLILLPQDEQDDCGAKLQDSLLDVPDEVLIAELRRRAAAGPGELEEIRRRAAAAQQLANELNLRERLLAGVELPSGCAGRESLKEAFKLMVESVQDNKPLSAEEPELSDEAPPSKKRKGHWPGWKVKKQGHWTGYEIVNTGGGMEWLQAKHGSEFWTYFNGKHYCMTVAEGMHPSDWKQMDPPPYKDDTSDGFVFVTPFPASGENSAST